MIHKTLDIKVDYEKLGAEKRGDFQPKLECYVPYNTRTPRAPRPTVVICPGGGYAFTSEREAEPIALAFLDKGFNCFVVWYSVTDQNGGNVARFPAALLEVATAVAMVRANAEEWMVDKDKVFVCGFSAGGHLTASIGTFWNRDFVKDALGFRNDEHKPNGVILSYAVISSEDWTHRGSMINLLGEKFEDPEMRELVSLEKQVTPDNVPAFIWHTYTDQAVPVRNSLDFAAALLRNGVPFELHIFPKGVHGIARADDSTSCDGEMIVPECAEWTALAAHWMREL